MRGRFVEDQGGRILQESPRDCYSLALPAGKLHATLADHRVEAFGQARDKIGKRCLFEGAMNCVFAGLGPSEVGSAFTGDDRFMGDYLRAELLSHVSAADASFLTRTSVLDRMSGPLCDAILRQKGSAADQK